MTDESLLYLLTRVRAENARLGISGMLLYKAGYFMQLLEGQLHELEIVYDRIERDPQHTEITILRSEIGPRMFPKWYMGFQNLGDWRDPHPKQPISTALNDPFHSDYFGPNPTKTQAMLLCFRGLGAPDVLDVLKRK